MPNGELASQEAILEHLNDQGYKNVEFTYNGIMYLEEFEQFFGVNPITDMPQLGISNDAYFTIDEDGETASVNVGSQRFGSFPIDG